MVRSCLLPALTMAMVVSAQTIPYDAAYKFGQPFKLAEGSEPSTLDLVATGQGRAGKVRVRQIPEGLVIAGRISGRQPEYYRFPADRQNGSYVGLWLASTPRIEMPEVGWGNQFGLTNCKTALADAGRNDPFNPYCRSWESLQSVYRAQLRGVFTRHWELTPEVAFETWASEAHHQLGPFLSDRNRADFAGLEPRERPKMVSTGGTDASFEILVPWEAFPPANTLNLASVYLAVEFCDPGRPCSSTSLALKKGEPLTFSKLTLAQPKVSGVSRCGYGLDATDLFRNKYQGWYLPNREGVIANVFALENLISGYQYFPTGVSPVPVWKHYFSRTVTVGEEVCGPDLRYVAGGKTWVAGPAEDADEFQFDPKIDEQHLEIRSVAKGAHLLKTGPTFGTRSPLGTGQCGAATTAEVAFYHLSPSQGVTVAFRQVLSTCTGLHDIRISPDWQTITVYQAQFDVAAEKEVWSFKRYCLAETKYEVCGEGPAAEQKTREIEWPFAQAVDPGARRSVALFRAGEPRMSMGDGVGTSVVSTK